MTENDSDSGNRISPVALGLISDPPTIVLTYDLLAGEIYGGGRKKRRKRKMPLRDFTDKSNVKRYAFNLRQRHNQYLANVIEVTLEKMLRIIQEIQKGNSVEQSLKIVEKEYSIDPEEDLNILSPAQLARKKAVMDEMFHKNLIRPGHPGYVYDKEVSFEDVVVGIEDNDWDKEEDGDKSGGESRGIIAEDKNTVGTKNCDMMDDEGLSGPLVSLKGESEHVENIFARSQSTDEKKEDEKENTNFLIKNDEIIHSNLFLMNTDVHENVEVLPEASERKGNEEEKVVSLEFEGESEDEDEQDALISLEVKNKSILSDEDKVEEKVNSNRAESGNQISMEERNNDNEAKEKERLEIPPPVEQEELNVKEKLPEVNTTKPDKEDTISEPENWDPDMVEVDTDDFSNDIEELLDTIEGGDGDGNEDDEDFWT